MRRAPGVRGFTVASRQLQWRRTIREQIDSHTQLSTLTNRCLSAGGRFQIAYTSFQITITRGSAFDRQQVNQRLSEIAKNTKESHQIRQALEHNEWKLTDGELAGLGSLSSPLLEKILPCLLYGSQPKDIETAITFGEAISEL